jgi:hypothetical protein
MEKNDNDNYQKRTGKMSYMIGIWTVDPEGTSPGPGWKPGKFVPNQKYGVHNTNLQAKRAYLAVHAPAFENLQAERVKWDFHQMTRARSWSFQQAKVLKVEQPKAEPILTTQSKQKTKTGGRSK